MALPMFEEPPTRKPQESNGRRRGRILTQRREASDWSGPAPLSASPSCCCCAVPSSSVSKSGGKIPSGIKPKTGGRSYTLDDSHTHTHTHILDIHILRVPKLLLVRFGATRNGHLSTRQSIWWWILEPDPPFTDSRATDGWNKRWKNTLNQRITSPSLLSRQHTGSILPVRHFPSSFHISWQAPPLRRFNIESDQNIIHVKFVSRNSRD